MAGLARAQVLHLRDAKKGNEIGRGSCHYLNLASAQIVSGLGLAEFPSGDTMY